MGKLPKVLTGLALSRGGATNMKGGDAMLSKDRSRLAETLLRTFTESPEHDSLLLSAHNALVRAERAGGVDRERVAPKRAEAK
jgi:hypothetical protein